MREAKVQVKFNTRELMRSIEQTASKRILEAANEVRNTVLETLSGDRSGRTYRVPGTRRTYTASAPGQPPAQATGRLRQSIKVSVRGEDRKVIGTVGTDLPYGKMLEFGTRNMSPRPWLRTSLEKTLPKIKQILGRKWL